ncbi:MAG: hypothetical protein NC183_01710 [Corallococcus sp.]|nr:hypothetical protein [Corallococcus sp.]MCM1359232.1 hypothetical protein [Corallococcus sp.]
MGGVLPVIIVCSIGIAACFGFLGYVLVQYLRKKYSCKKRIEYDLDDKTLTIKLDKKDFRK